MTAREVLSAGLDEQGCAYPNAAAELLISALRAAGYAVIELPDESDENEWEGEPDWRVWYRPERPYVALRVSSPLHIPDARGMAAALLAAADAAEATS